MKPRAKAVTANEAAAIRLALGHNPDTADYEAIARKHGLGVSTVRGIKAAGSRGRRS